MMFKHNHCCKHYKHEKLVHTLGIIALLLLISHHAMALCHAMKKKKHGGIQNKVEQIQQMFEQLMDK